MNSNNTEINNDTGYKTCTMCGEEKPHSAFRTQRRKGKGSEEATYQRPYCMTCEAIEVRRQYLLGFVDLPPERQQELDKINELYKRRLAAGLKTFGSRKCRRGAVINDIEAQLSKLPAQKGDV